MKKLIYYVLICTLVISTIGFSSGMNVSAASNLNMLSEINDSFSESFEMNGVHYFYEDTNNYTLTITKAPNGEEIIAYKDKLSGNDDEIYYQYTPGTNENTNFKATKETSLLNTSEKQKLNTIKEKVLHNEIILEKRSIQDFGTVTTHLAESKDISALAATSDIDKINYSLASEYGAQYVNKYLTSLTKDGYTGYLYQHMTFGATPKVNVLYDALTSIGIVATFAGVAQLALLEIGAWISAGAEAYQLLMPTEFHKYDAKVYYQKEVKVGTIFPYRSFYELSFNAVTGSKGYAALSKVTSTYKSNDYDNNTSILTTGIANYIKIK